MPDQPAVTITRNARSTAFATDEIADVATVRYQGGWIVRCEWGDSFSSQRVASREYAESLALRHALHIAA